METAKDRPVLMNTVSVGGILDDIKTQTRRVIKPQQISVKECVKLTGSTYSFFKGHNEKGWSIAGPCGVVLEKSGIADNGMYTWKSPYGKIGDRLWVRETWQQFFPEDWNKWPEMLDYYNKTCAWNDECKIFYKANGPVKHPVYGKINWKPSIHISRIHSRILLEITDIRVERVQDISRDDCIKEGIPQTYGGFKGCVPEWASKDKNDASYFYDNRTSRENFCLLWNSINAKPKPVMANGKIVSYISYPWEDIREMREHRGLKWVVCGNPHVWAVTFKVLKKEV